MMRAAQDRITVMEGIREAGTVVGDGVASFLTDTTKVATTVGVITAIAAGVYGARMGASVSGKYIADKLIKVKTVHSFALVLLRLGCGGVFGVSRVEAAQDRCTDRTLAPTAASYS